jgi:hypothetical protein
LGSSSIIGRSSLKGLSVFAQPGLETLKVSVSVIGDWLGSTSWVEDESWVSSNVDALSLVGGGIELTNNHVGVVLVEFGELIPDWEKLLAVSTPWGVELNEDILILVKSNLSEVLSNDNLDTCWVLVLWDFLGFEMRLSGSANNTVNPSSDGLNGRVSDWGWESVLLHLVWLDGHQDWKLVLLDSHEFSELLLDSNGSVRVGEKDLSLVGFSGLSEDLDVVRAIIIFRSEENKGVLLLSENGLDLILGEFEESWDHEWLEEGIEGILVGSTGIDVLLSLELSEEDLSWGNNSVMGSATSISGMVERDLVFGRSGGLVSVLEKIGRFLSEENKSEFISSNLSLNGIAVGEDGWWSGLLGDP